MVRHLVHPKAMSSVFFLLDIVFSISSDIIGFFETSRTSAIAIIAVFSITGVLVIVPFSLFVFIYSDHSKIGFVAWVIQMILAVGYYYGKYINGILIRYGTFLNCDANCLRANQFIALFSLLLAILFLNYVIPKLHLVIQKRTEKKHHIYEHYFFGVITVCVNANAIFATLSLIPADIQCTPYAVIFSTVFLLVISVVAAIKIYTDYLEEREEKDRKEEKEGEVEGKKEENKEEKQEGGEEEGGEEEGGEEKGGEVEEREEQEKDKENNSFNLIYPSFQKVVALIFGYYLLFFLVPFYLVGNNQLPLEYINCNTSSGGFVDTGRIADHIVRLLFMLITAATVMFALYAFWKARKNSLKKASNSFWEVRKASLMKASNAFWKELERPK